jgi:hypothetical protein
MVRKPGAKMAKPVVVLSSSRSGTNYFLSVFKETVPDAVVLREVFRPGGDSLTETSSLTGVPQDRLAKVGQEEPTILWEMLQRAVGARPLALKIFYYHAKPECSIWDRIAKEARIVHLIRRRVLDSLISRKLAEASGQWIMPSGSSVQTDAPKIHIDPSEARAFINQRQSYVRTFRERFRGADIHEIGYEDISKDPFLCAREIARLVGQPVPSVPLRLPIRKQNTWTNPEIVSNYEEIMALDEFHL